MVTTFKHDLHNLKILLKSFLSHKTIEKAQRTIYYFMYLAKKCPECRKKSFFPSRGYELVFAANFWYFLLILLIFDKICTLCRPNELKSGANIVKFNFKCGLFYEKML